MWLPLYELTCADPYEAAEQLKDSLDDQLRVVEDIDANTVYIERYVEEGEAWEEYATGHWPSDGEYHEIIASTGAMVSQRTDLRAVFDYTEGQCVIEQWTEQP